MHTTIYAASFIRLVSFDRVARLSFLPEPLAASMIEFHDIPRLSMFMMAVLASVLPRGGRDICLRSLPWQSPCICQRVNCDMRSAGPCSYAGRDVEFELALTGCGRVLDGEYRSIEGRWAQAEALP
jgi:hypothetical protein